MKLKIVLPIIAIALFLVALSLKFTQQENQKYLGTAPAGGDFVLQTNKGPFDLQEQRGKIVLIYFGYTYCPDICPTNLSIMTQALNELEEQELAQVQPVFISVDPQRDTLSHLENYTRFFHDRIIGMTGDEETIANIARLYGAAYKKVMGESEGGYLVDHSSFTYLIDQQGKLKNSFPHATNPQNIVNTIRTYLTR